MYFRDGSWWFTTRESIEVGPYDSEHEAESDSRKLTKILRKITEPIKGRLVIREFAFRPAAMRRGREHMPIEDPEPLKFQ
jgi:hypothetical protein